MQRAPSRPSAVTCGCASRGSSAMLILRRRGYLPLVVSLAGWESELGEALVGTPDMRQLALPPNRLADFMRAITQAFDAAAAGGEAPVLLTSALLRQHVRAIIERMQPSMTVLAQTEIFPRARIRTVGTI